MANYPPRYSKIEDNFIREHRGRKPYSWIAEKLGRPNRHAIRKRVQRLGLPPIPQIIEERRKIFLEKIKRKEAPLLQESGFIKPPSEERLMGRR